MYSSIVSIPTRSQCSGVSDQNTTLSYDTRVKRSLLTYLTQARHRHRPSLPGKCDGVECHFPGPLGAAVVDDCNEICCHFLGHVNDWVHLQPLQIVTWLLGTCYFGLLNLNPCRCNSWQLSRFTSICQAMLARCIMDGYDVAYHGGDNGFMAILTGDDAAPPYEDYPC
jgi:hypothetical protein